MLNDLLSNKINRKLSFDDFEDLDMYTATTIADVLSIQVSDILKNPETPSFIYSSKRFRKYQETYKKRWNSFL